MVIWEFTIPARVVGDQVMWVFITGSVYTVALLAIDRCLAVLKSAYWARVVTATKIKVTLFLIFICSAIINGPTYFTEKYVTMLHPIFNKTFLISQPTAYGASSEHTETFLQRVAGVYIVFLPIVIFLACCVALIIETVIRRQRGLLFQRQITTSSADSALSAVSTSPAGIASVEGGNKSSQMTESTSTNIRMPAVSTKDKSGEIDNNSENQVGRGLRVSDVTAVIFTITVIGILNRIIFGIWMVFGLEEDSFLPRFSSNRFVWAGAIRFLFLNMNASSVFIIYMIFDRKFRSTLKAICCPSQIRRQKIGQSYVYQNQVCVAEGDPKEKLEVNTVLYGINIVNQDTDLHKEPAEQSQSQNVSVNLAESDAPQEICLKL